jgi:hypothetical protein
MANERLIDQLIPQGRKVHPVQWPDSGNQVGIVVPTCAELQEAFAAARRHVSSNLALALEATVNGSLVQEEEEIHILARVVLNTSSGRILPEHDCHLFKGPSEARERLSTDLRLYLVAHLSKLQEATAEGWGWPDDGDSRSRMAKALGLSLGASLPEIASAVERLTGPDVD